MDSGSARSVPWKRSNYGMLKFDSHVSSLTTVQDSSAIHVIPRVRVVQRYQSTVNNEGTLGSMQVFLLKVSNPTLGSVRLRFSKSAFGGEKEYWNDSAGESSTNGTATLFAGLLVDTLEQRFIQAKLKPSLMNDLETTGTVELLSAEDSIIELRGKTLRTPELVMNWDPELVLKRVDTSAGSAPFIRLVTQSAADAWFELVVLEPHADVSLASAVPLALEVDLGHGSWESSLIPANDVAKDMVVFDLVLVWKE
jgi:hypothetical protein